MRSRFTGTLERQHHNLSGVILNIQPLGDATVNVNWTYDERSNWHHATCAIVVEFCGVNVSICSKDEWKGLVDNSLYIKE
jgi:hypothetical protein